MRYFDLHCDTIVGCYDRPCKLYDNPMHVSLEKAAIYEQFTQLLAIYSRPALTDDQAYERCLNVINYFNTLDYPKNFRPILAIECGKLIGGKLERVDELYRLGIRFMTMVWGSYTCIGGAHNDGRGYTEFGKEALKRCFEVGIVPDMSHASDALFWETAEEAEKCGKPFICTHSNSRAVREHTRNLTDDMFREVMKCGGVVGISLCTSHLTDTEECTIDHVVKHIEHYMSLGGEKTVAMGCDLDGISKMPEGISGVGDIYKIADRLCELNYTQAQVDAIMFDNANNFVLRNGIIK